MDKTIKFHVPNWHAIEEWWGILHLNKQKPALKYRSEMLPRILSYQNPPSRSYKNNNNCCGILLG